MLMITLEIQIPRSSGFALAICKKFLLSYSFLVLLKIFFCLASQYSSCCCCCCALAALHAATAITLKAGTSVTANNSGS